jgi:predicted transcriptional regulator YheO
MEEHNVTLTPADRVILKSYRSFIDGLSLYLGDGYEIVLHSLEDCSRSVIKIINGYHTRRTEGAPITDLALEMLEKIRAQGAADTGGISYSSRNKNGEPLWSSTIPIIGEKDRIIGLMCINLYLNTPFYDIIRNYTPQRPADLNWAASRQENFADSVDDLVESTIRRVRDEVVHDPAISSNQKNKEIIIRLHERGIFNLKDAVARTAAYLNISKNTVYMHIRNLDEP